MTTDGGRVTTDGGRVSEVEWKPLHDELEHWQRAGRVADLWWRDDDAVADGPALRRLLDGALRHAAPLALAVIPAALTDSLAAALAGTAVQQVQVLQHGHSHANRQAPDQRKAEFGAGTDPCSALDEIRRGRAALAGAFGSRFLPVFVPPWNRLDAAIMTVLPGAGLRGVSTFKPRATAAPVAGLTQVNCHVDIIDWRAGRRFAGTAACVAALSAHLRARRLGQQDGTECSGVLTHHLVHDDACWAFMAELLARVAAHPALRWRSAVELFP